MLQPIIYTQQGFSFSSWLEAWPQAQLCSELISNDSKAIPFVLVWAGLENWLDIIQHHAQQQQAVLVLSKLDTLAELQAALTAGARGYVHFASDKDTLLAASESILQGALWIPHNLLANLVGVLNQALPKKKSNPFAELSEREQQVAEAVCRGLTNKAIANELNVSERTVKQHLTNSFAKLGVQDRMQLLLLSRNS